MRRRLVSIVIILSSITLVSLVVLGSTSWSEAPSSYALPRESARGSVELSHPVSEMPLGLVKTQEDQQPTTDDDALRNIIAESGLVGDPSIGCEIPDIESPLAQLGMKLFFSKALGGDMDTACVTCHHPLLGGGDGLRVSIGVDADYPDLLGPGRTHPSGYTTVPRNAPTTFNIGLWDQFIFHDGRLESIGKTPTRHGNDGMGIVTPDSSSGVADGLAGDNLSMAQSRFPVTSQEEMRGFRFEAGHDNEAVRIHLASRLGRYDPGRSELEYDRWPAEFRETFDSREPLETLISPENIFRAIGEYERSQVFVDTPWKAYVQGDLDSLSQEAKRGALLFFTPVAEGGVGCASCHTGDKFSDEQFHVLAIPQIGPGKGDGPTQDDDFGRYRVTKDPKDLYAFRTPMLLNVEVTGPYGHDGAYLTLEGIVRHHLNPAAAVTIYDFSTIEPDMHVEHAWFNTQQALNKLLADRAEGLPTIEDVELSDEQVSNLISFLYALTDPCVKDPECLAPWIPSPSDRDPDRLRVEFASARQIQTP